MKLLKPILLALVASQVGQAASSAANYNSEISKVFDDLEIDPAVAIRLKHRYEGRISLSQLTDVEGLEFFNPAFLTRKQILDQYMVDEAEYQLKREMVEHTHEYIVQLRDEFVSDMKETLELQVANYFKKNKLFGSEHWNQILRRNDYQNFFKKNVAIFHKLLEKQLKQNYEKIAESGRMLILEQAQLLSFEQMHRAPERASSECRPNDKRAAYERVEMDPIDQYSSAWNLVLLATHDVIEIEYDEIKGVQFSHMTRYLDEYLEKFSPHDIQARRDSPPIKVDSMIDDLKKDKHMVLFDSYRSRIG